MQVTNAIAWAHLQLRGGWRNVLLTAGGYAAVIGILIFASLRFNPSAGPVLAAWTMALLWLQILALIPLGCWSVSAAIRKDVNTKMIESHRLMPVSGTDAVVGYVLGPASLAIAVSIVNVLIGMATVQGSVGMGTGMANWLKANAVLYIFSVCAWTVLAFLPLVMPVGSRIMVGMVWVLFVGHQGIAPLVPGLTLLFGPALNDSVMGVMMKGTISVGLQISMLAQLLVAVLCYIGAVRKYRRDDVLAWGPLLGLVALAAYVVISLAGIVLWDDIRPRLLNTERVDFEIKALLAAVGGLFAGVIPVSAVVWMRTRWEQRRGLNDPAPNPRPIAIILVVMAAAVIGAALLPIAIEGRDYLLRLLPSSAVTQLKPMNNLQSHLEPREMAIRTVIVFFTFLWSMSYLLRILYRSQLRARWLGPIFAVFMCLLPLIADFIVNGALKHFESEKIFSEISGCSPVVALVYIWMDVPGYSDPTLPMNTNYGLAVQAAVALLLGGLFYWNLQRERRAGRIPVMAVG